MSSYQRYPLKHWKLSAKVNDHVIRLYGYIVTFYAQHEYFPTVRQMAAEMGGCSTSTVDYYVRVLIQRDWIERVGSAVRNLRLTRPTERGLKPAQLRALLDVELVALDPPPFEVRKDRNWKRHERRRIRRQVRPFQG